MLPPKSQTMNPEPETLNLQTKKQIRKARPLSRNDCLSFRLVLKVLKALCPPSPTNPTVPPQDGDAGDAFQDGATVWLEIQGFGLMIYGFGSQAMNPLDL